MILTDDELRRINEERAKKDLPPLTMKEALRAIREKADERIKTSQHVSDPGGFDMTHFLIGYMTGIPMPSPAGFAGAMMHPTSPAQSEPVSVQQPTAEPEPVHVQPTAAPEPSYSAPEPSYSPPASDPTSGGSFSGGGE